MRKLPTARWRRYALALVVVGASVGVIGCLPTKDQPPPQPPPCTGADAATETCLQIQPTFQNFTRGQTFSFTVTNLGPGNALLGVQVAFFADSFFIPAAGNGCAPPKTLSPGASCSFAVQAVQTAGGQIPVDYAVQICGNCQRIQSAADIPGRGVAAQIVLTG